MGYNNRPKMPVSMRAKQFAPFSALKGLEKAFAEKRRALNFAEKAKLSEEMQQHINDKLNKLKINSFVTIKYYNLGEYLTIMGHITLIDNFNKALIIGDEKIKFDDIFDLEIE